MESRLFKRPFRYFQVSDNVFLYFFLIKKWHLVHFSFNNFSYIHGKNNFSRGENSARCNPGGINPMFFSDTFSCNPPVFTYNPGMCREGFFFVCIYKSMTVGLCRPPWPLTLPIRLTLSPEHPSHRPSTTTAGVSADLPAAQRTAEQGGPETAELVDEIAAPPTPKKSSSFEHFHWSECNRDGFHLF